MAQEIPVSLHNQTSCYTHIVVVKAKHTHQQLCGKTVKHCQAVANACSTPAMKSYSSYTFWMSEWKPFLPVHSLLLPCFCIRWIAVMKILPFPGSQVNRQELNNATLLPWALTWHLQWVRSVCILFQDSKCSLWFCSMVPWRLSLINIIHHMSAVKMKLV